MCNKFPHSTAVQRTKGELSHAFAGNRKYHGVLKCIRIHRGHPVASTAMKPITRRFVESMSGTPKKIKWLYHLR